MEYQWAYRGGTEPHFQSIVSDSETGETVAVVFSDQGNKKATLISAAPELFQKLADLLDYLGPEWVNDPMVEECQQLLNELQP